MSKPMSFQNEWDFLVSHLSKDQIMVEYGSGHSTYELAPRVKKLISIEHNKDWFNNINSKVKALDNVEYIFIPPEKGAPNKLRGIDPKWFYTYITWPKTRNEKFDVVLIDGRARQYVAESILGNITEDSYVFIHDWNPKIRDEKYRIRYERILEFYNVVNSERKMTLLKKK